MRSASSPKSRPLIQREESSRQRRYLKNLERKRGSGFLEISSSSHRVGGDVLTDVSFLYFSRRAESPWSDDARVFGPRIRFMWAAGKENKGTRDDGDDIRGSNGGMTGQEEEEKEGGRARNEREVGSIERAGKQNTKRIYLWRLSKQETPGPPTREAAFRADLVSSFFLLSSFFSFFFETGNESTKANSNGV